jgi:hypothetical protein
LAGAVSQAYRSELVARGNPYREGSRKTVVILDDDTFGEVRQRAVANGCSFAAEARMLIEVGLEALKADGQ